MLSPFITVNAKLLLQPAKEIKTELRSEVNINLKVSINAAHNTQLCGGHFGVSYCSGCRIWALSENSGAAAES